MQHEFCAEPFRRNKLLLACGQIRDEASPPLESTPPIVGVAAVVLDDQYPQGLAFQPIVDAVGKSRHGIAPDLVLQDGPSHG